MTKFLCASLVLTLLFSCRPAVKGNADEAVFTRAEAVKMVVEMVRENHTYYADADAFADTPDADITYAKAINLVYGRDGNLFDPAGSFSQQDFLLVLKRGIDRAAPDLFYNNTKIKAYQNRAEVSEYARYSLDYLTIINVLTEYHDLCPSQPMSRQDAALYIERAKYAIQYAEKSSPDSMPVKNYPKVLLYHRIENQEIKNEYLYLCVTPENFEQQIKYLVDNGYVFLFPEEVSYCDSYEKSVVVTFDDGFSNNYKCALPILEKYNAKATLFIYADAIGEPWMCDAEQLCAMNLKGVFRIYAHSRTHPDLTTLTETEIINQYAYTNDLLYSITKRDINSLAYPYGCYNQLVLKQARRYYKHAFSGYRSEGRSDAHTIKRETVEHDFDLNEFVKILKR